MITINIKTPKDYWKEFMAWLKTARQHDLKDISALCDTYCQEEVEKKMTSYCKLYNITDTTAINEMIEYAQLGIMEGCKRVDEFIKDVYPKQL